MFVRQVIAVALCASMFVQAVPLAAGKTSAKKAKSPAEQIRANEELLQKLEPLLTDQDYADADLRRFVIDKIIALRCENKALTLDEVLGRGVVSAAERDAVVARCTARETAALGGSLGDNPPRSNLELKTLPSTASVPGCPAPTIPPPGVPSSRAFTTPDDARPATTFKARNVNTLKDTGSQIVGEHTITVEYFNILRFQYAIGGATTITEAPVIPQALGLSISAFPSKPVPLSTGVVTKADNKNLDALVNDFNTAWRDQAKCFEGLQDAVVKLDALINDAAGVTMTTTSHINATLNGNAAKLVGDYHPLREAARDPEVFREFYYFNWPTRQIGDLRIAITMFQRGYALLPATVTGYGEWSKESGNKLAFDFITTQGDKMIEHLTALAPTSDAAVKLQAAQDATRQWLKHFDTIANTNRAGFTPQYNVACDDAWFGRGKYVTVKLFTRDRALPSPAEETSELVTVVCLPPLTISTGLGFSAVPDKVFNFVPGKLLDSSGNPVLDSSGNPVIVDRIGATSEAHVKPVYALQINGSVKEWTSSGIGAHATLGVDIAGTNDSSNMEFFVGPSFSFYRRAFFITPAFQFARRSELLPGFKLGEIRGNLSSIPTQTRWRTGFVFTITFPVAGSGTIVK